MSMWGPGEEPGTEPPRALEIHRTTYRSVERLKCGSLAIRRLKFAFPELLSLHPSGKRVDQPMHDLDVAPYRLSRLGF